MSKHNTLRIYHSFLQSHSHSFSCPHCDIPVLPSRYENHCENLHHMDPKTECVWCQGKVSWPAKRKYENADHLKQCFFNSIHPPVENIPVPVRIKPTTYTRFKMEHTCPEKDFRGRQKLDILPEEAYLPIGHMDLDPLPLTYQDENSNLAAACVRKYLETVGEMEWFHVMIRATALQSFLNVVNRDDGGTQVLPFSCWCDGGTTAYPQYRHHRHMIVFAPKDHLLQHVWNRIIASDKPRKNFKTKLYKVIDSAHHLVNAIQYVSQYRSKCRGSFDEDSPNETERHFHVFKGLPIDIKYILTTLWDGGVLEWIAEKYQNMSQNQLAMATHVERRHGYFKLKVGDIPGITLNLVLPVSRCFVPASHPTEIFIHLNGRNKLYFEKLDRPLPEEEWFQHQVAGGNVFFHAVAEEWWKPRQRLQKVLHTVQLVTGNRDQQIEYLRAENSKLKAAYAQLEMEYAQLENEMVQLRTEIENGQKDRLIRQLETQNVQLRTQMENGQKDRLIQQLETENIQLRTQMDNRRKDRLIQQLKTEIAQLRTEIKTVKRIRLVDN